jgi:hypothetical protein
MFALCLYEKTAKQIANTYQVRLDKNQPAQLEDDSLLLWAFDWVESNRPGGMWILLTKTRQDAARILAVKDNNSAYQTNCKSKLASQNSSTTLLLSNTTITLDWHGPYTLLHQPDTKIPCIFASNDCGGCGVYLFTVEHNNGYLINYVGETKCFQKRFHQHIKWSFDGKDHVAAEPDQFRHGIREAHEFSDAEFNKDHAKWSAWIEDNYLAYRVFVAYNEEFVSQDIRRYVEAAIIRTLADTGGSIKDFLYHPNINKYKNVSPTEPFLLQFPTSPVLHGLTGKNIRVGM